LQDAVEGGGYSNERDHSSSEFCESEVLKQGGFFFQPDISRVANIRIYFVLLRSLVAVTTKVLQLIVALRNKVETFLSEKKKHRAPAVLKIQARIKMAYLSYISTSKHEIFSKRPRSDSDMTDTKVDTFQGKD
jgi:hypothetical protein